MEKEDLKLKYKEKEVVAESFANFRYLADSVTINLEDEAWAEELREKARKS